MLKPHGHPCVAFLPFCRHKFSVPKPPNPKYPAVLATLGDHIRKRRLDLGLTQKQAAKLMGVDPFTVLNYEKGNTTPPISCVAHIIRFVGYVPFPPATTLGEKLRLYRKVNGLTQKELALQLGVDPGTLASWESGEHRPMKRCLVLLNEVFREPH